MVFPGTILGLRTELLLGGTWTDISSFLNEGTDSIGITRGHPDESTTTTASQTGFTLANNDNRFTLRNPAGAYYPNLTRNVPARLSVPAQATYLRMESDTVSFISCPDTAGISVTGDTDIRIDLGLTGYQPASLAGKYQAAGNERSWVLALHSDGTLIFTWSTAGTAATVSQAFSTLPVPLGRGSLRVTLAVATGTVTFYTGPAGGADGSSWTQLGTAVITGATSVFNSTAPMLTGYSAGLNADNATYSGMTGAVYEFELRNGIGGTVVAHPVFGSQTAGATSFTDAQSNTWTVSGTAELSGRLYRGHFEAIEWPLSSDPAGRDVTVGVSASGVLRRVSQGQSTVSSPMDRAFTRITGALAPVAYWPAEDGAGSSSLASGIGGRPMQIAGSPTLASDSGFNCTTALPVMNGGGFYGIIPTYTSNGSIIVRFLMNVQTAPSNGARIMRVITTGTCLEWSLYWATGGGLGMAGFNAAGTVFDTGGVAFAVDGQKLWVSMELQPGTGGLVDFDIVTLVPGAATGSGFSGSFTGTIGNATALYPAPTQALGAVTLGQFSVQSEWESLFALAGPLMAWEGETAANRFARLCGEQGLSCRIYGYPDVSAPMGIQTLETFEALLQECVDADLGVMYEPFESLGLGYRTQASMLNQAPVATIGYQQLANELKPTEDDQAIVNDVTVTQVAGDGSSAHLTDTVSPLSVNAPGATPPGVGLYDQQYDVNLAADAQLSDNAGWRLHIGTVDENRYPAIIIDLATFDTAVQALLYPVLGLRMGDRVVITNPPPWLPPGSIDQLVQGTAPENLYDFVLNLTLQGVPSSPYRTVLLDDAVQGRADTDGSALVTGISSTATSMSVATASALSPVWTPNSGDWPFDVAMGGEQITVTAVSGTTSPQAFTVTRSVNGVVKAHLAGEDIRLWIPPVLAMI